VFGPIGGGLDRLTQLVSKAEKKSENARRLRSRASNPRAGKAELNGTPPNETGPFLVVTTRSLRQRLLVVTRERSEIEPKGGHPTRRRALLSWGRALRGRRISTSRPPRAPWHGPVCGVCPTARWLRVSAPGQQSPPRQLVGGRGALAPGRRPRPAHHERVRRAPRVPCRAPRARCHATATRNLALACKKKKPAARDVGFVTALSASGGVAIGGGASVPCHCPQIIHPTESAHSPHRRRTHACHATKRIISLLALFATSSTMHRLVGA
jgi:hypothetical protein